MKVLLYTEGYKTISKSGLGKAIKHQMKALEDNNIPYTTNLKDDFDILHVNFYGPKSYLFTKRMRKKGKKIIYHAHSTEEDFRNSFKFSNLVAPLFKKWICTCYKLGDQIITPTEYSKKILEGYNLNRPIKAISNGVDTNFLEHDAKAGQTFREKYGYQKKDKVIVGIGLYIERKGILDFVELAKRLPQYKFIWFGYSPLWASPHKIRKAVNTKLDNLVFAGYVDNSMIKAALSGADLYLFPTLEETEGIPIIEALTAKIPTLIRDIPIFDEYETDKVVYKASNIDEFEEKIKLILEKKLPDLTKEGYKVAKKKDLKVVGKMLADTYYETLNLKREEKPKRADATYFRSLAIVLMMILFFITMILKSQGFVKLSGLTMPSNEEVEKTSEYHRLIEYMDTSIDIKVYAPTADLGNRALDEAESIYKEYDQLTSRSNPDSDLNKISKSDSDEDYLTINHQLYDMIAYGLDWYEKSDKLLDIRAGALTDLWQRYYEKQKGIPSEAEIEEAQDKIKDIVLKDDDKIKNNHPNINLDSFRLGYATDKVTDTLKLLKIDKYIINAGGNIVLGNHYEKGGKYNIIIDSPFKGDENSLSTLRLTNYAISTTSLYKKYYTYAENDYGLTINPLTGKQPKNDIVGVTVIAKSLKEAQIYSTILYLMDISEGQKIVNKIDNLEAIWAYRYKNENDFVISDHFYQLS